MTALTHVYALVDEPMPDAARAAFRTVLARLAETCPDHERCDACGAVLCQSCGIGEPARCTETLADHCADPECWCRACHHDYAVEERADRLYEMRRGL